MMKVTMCLRNLVETRALFGVQEWERFQCEFFWICRVCSASFLDLLRWSTGPRPLDLLADAYPSGTAPLRP